MPHLILLRHGQSQWNLENRFTGWVDVDLTPLGEEQARQAGQAIAASGIEVGMVFTSMQTRAIRTAWLAQEAMDCCWLPQVKSWRLNERHYGGLTGLDKAQTVAEHGEEQVNIWRRSYDVPPPSQDRADPDHPIHDRRYANVPKGEMPDGESLAMTLARVLPYWEDVIAPQLRLENVLIVAHGNSLRSLVKHLYGLDEHAIMHVEIPTGNPLVIELNDALVPVQATYLDKSRAQDLPNLPDL